MIAAQRLKRAVRAAIDLCGGIDGAQATVERVQRSQVGNWNALNHPDLPMLHDALALDEIAVASERAPPILTRLASELGHVAIRLPSGIAGEDAETGALAAAIAEFGDIARALMDGRADGELSRGERETIAEQIDEALAALVRMKAVVLPDALAPAAVPVRRVTN